MNVSQLLDVMVLTLIWAGIAGAWNFLAGFGGQFSLGHAAFVGIGAYGAAIAATRYGLTPWIGLLAGMFLAGLLAFFIGSISLRMRGPFFTLLTIAFAEMVRLIALYAKHLTNGAEGIIIELKPGLVNLYFLEKWPFVVLAGIYALGIGASVRRRSPLSPRIPLAGGARRRGCGAVAWCAGISATRDCNGHQRRVCGCQAVRYLAMYTQFIDPDSTMSFLLSVEAGLITIVGGLGHPWGPLFGAILIVPFERLLRSMVWRRAVRTPRRDLRPLVDRDSVVRCRRGC